MKILLTLIAISFTLLTASCTTKETTIIYRDQPAPKYSSNYKKPSPTYKKETTTTYKKPSPPKERYRTDSDGRRHRDVAAEDVEPAESVLRVDR